MRKHGDCCPLGCGIVATPTIWSPTAAGAKGTYICSTCGHTWTTYYSARLDDIEWSA